MTREEIINRLDYIETKGMQHGFIVLNKKEVEALGEAIKILKRSNVEMDCLSCSHSMSADDEDGNPVLVCSEQSHKVVSENGTCWKWG